MVSRSPVVSYLRRVALGSATAERTDAELLQSFVDRRDEVAFEALLVRHGPMVHAVCQRILHDPHDVDDAFQATFLVLVRRAGVIARQTSLGSWLHGVALRTSWNARTRRANRRIHEQLAFPPRSIDEEADLVWRDLRPVLDEEIQRLSEPYRSLVVLCYLEGKSYTEAARRLGCVLGTVSTRLNKARKLLRQRLVCRGVTLSVAALSLVLARQVAASVPMPLALATSQAVREFSVTARVAALAKGVLQTMSLSVLKRALVGVVLVVAGSASLALAWPHLPVQESTPPHPAAVSSEPFDSRTALLRTFTGHTDRVASVTFSPDGKCALSASFDRTVRLWDVATSKELLCLRGHGDRSDCAIFTPDGQRALSCSWDGTVRLWDLRTGKELKCFGATGKPGIHITRLACFPDGKRFLCMAHDNDTLQVRDMETGEVLKDFGPHDGHVLPVALSADGSKVLEGTYDLALPVRLWDVASGKLVQEFKGHPARSLAVALSPDGRLALTAGESEPVRLWDTATGRLIGSLVHPRGACGLAFTPDGRYAVTGGVDQTVRVWHVATRKELCCFFGHVDYIDSIAISPDGRLALSAANDRTIRLWQLPR